MLTNAENEFDRNSKKNALNYETTFRQILIYRNNFPSGHARLVTVFRNPLLARLLLISKCYLLLRKHELAP